MFGRSLGGQRRHIRISRARAREVGLHVKDQVLIVPETATKKKSFLSRLISWRGQFLRAGLRQPPRMRAGMHLAQRADRPRFLPWNSRHTTRTVSGRQLMRGMDL